MASPSSHKRPRKAIAEVYKVLVVNALVQGHDWPVSLVSWPGMEIEEHFALEQGTKYWYWVQEVVKIIHEPKR